MAEMPDLPPAGTDPSTRAVIHHAAEPWDGFQGLHDAWRVDANPTDVDPIPLWRDLSPAQQFAFLNASVAPIQALITIVAHVAKDH